MKILIIEDNTEFQKLLTDFLHGKGFEVDNANDGNTGCEMCIQKKYDLIIMDIFLPGKDGVQVIHELKEEFSKDVKIIAISGSRSEGMTKHALELSKKHGADEILHKPFDLNILLNSINKLLDIHP